MWKKLDFRFVPSGEKKWSQTHATVPTPFHINGDLYRVYYSTRDDSSRNRVGFVELEISSEIKFIRESKDPVIELGELGYFDCDGVYATSLVNTGSELRFYYAGWNAGLRGVFYSSIGVAISVDGGETFERYSPSPILSRDVVDPWAVMAPFVLRINDSNWKMWYASGIKLYYDHNGKLKSFYDIKTALSKDGFIWNKTGKTSIDLGGEDSNIARACVMVEDGNYKVWYPYIRQSVQQYRVGYGESSDGLNFRRMDESPMAMLQPSTEPTSWDSKAVTYPFIFKHKGKYYMLYNGNEFGKDGFGIAISE
jgi:predicted GH43/DUF377 family glycosyl hydrolase